MKILSFSNTDDHRHKIEKINLYSFNRHFWSDFPSDRYHNTDDVLIFLLPIYEKILLKIYNYQDQRKTIMKIKVLWDRYAKELGEKSTPQEVIMSIVNSFMLRVYTKKEFRREWVRIVDIIFESYFTPIRIRNIKKLNIVKN